jgi:Flp pilus assembly protein TadD
LQLSLVEERAGNFPAAREAIGEAIDRAPDDWSLWYVAARIERKAGDVDAAVEAFLRARALNPRAEIFRREEPPREGRVTAPAEQGSADGGTQ